MTASGRLEGGALVDLGKPANHHTPHGRTELVSTRGMRRMTMCRRVAVRAAKARRAPSCSAAAATLGLLCARGLLDGDATAFRFALPSCGAWEGGCKAVCHSCGAEHGGAQVGCAVQGFLPWRGPTRCESSKFSGRRKFVSTFAGSPAAVLACRVSCSRSVAMRGAVNPQCLVMPA